MRIAIAGGHSRAAQGAVGLLNEYDCDRAYVAQLISALRAAGHEVVDCSNEKATVNDELAEEVRLANASGADLFIAVHFNAGGGTGTECWYWTGNEGGRELSARMSANVAAALGLRDRGAKDTTSLYVIKRTNMRAVLLEVCFVDTEADAAAWHATSWEALTAAVVNAIGGVIAAPSEPAQPAQPAPQPAPAQASGANIAEDGWWGTDTTKAVQKALGTPVDGVVSCQDSRDMARVNGGGLSSGWQIGRGGSQMVGALQRKLGVNDDKYFGPETCKALQAYLGTPVDGVVSGPSQMVEELQRRLNAGTF